MRKLFKETIFDDIKNNRLQGYSFSEMKANQDDMCFNITESEKNTGAWFTESLESINAYIELIKEAFAHKETRVFINSILPDTIEMPNAYIDNNPLDFIYIIGDMITNIMVASYGAVYEKYFDAVLRQSENEESFIQSLQALAF